MIVMPVRADGPVSSSTQPQQQPAASTERKPMSRTPSTNGNGDQSSPAAESKPALELALEQIEAVKASYREAIRGLNDLGDTLKQVQREHKPCNRNVRRWRDSKTSASDNHYTGNVQSVAVISSRTLLFKKYLFFQSRFVIVPCFLASNFSSRLEFVGHRCNQRVHLLFARPFAVTLQLVQPMLNNYGRLTTAITD